MKEAFGDLWEFVADTRVITTNGTIKKNGEAVMGRGCAHEAKQRYKTVAYQLGCDILKYGNVPGYLRTNLATLPVKHNWWERADLELIEESTRKLVDLVNWTGAESIVMPRPGCGNGGLDWSEVKPIIEPLLDDRFTVITNERE